MALCATALVAVVSARAEDTKLFFGEIPIQYVGRGEKIVLDLHRFLHPPEASVHVDGTDAKSAHDISLDPSPEISGSKLKNLLTEEQIALTDGKLSVTIPPSAALFIGQR